MGPTGGPAPLLFRSVVGSPTTSCARGSSTGACRPARGSVRASSPTRSGSRAARSRGAAPPRRRRSRGVRGQSRLLRGGLGPERVLERLEARLLLEPGSPALRPSAGRRMISTRFAVGRGRAIGSNRGGGARREPGVPRCGRRRDAQRGDVADLRLALDRRRGSPASCEPPLAARLAGRGRRRARALRIAIEACDGALAESLMRAHVESAWRHWARRPSPAATDLADGR